MTSDAGPPNYVSLHCHPSHRLLPDAAHLHSSVATQSITAANCRGAARRVSLAPLEMLAASSAAAAFPHGPLPWGYLHGVLVSAAVSPDQLCLLYEKQRNLMRRYAARGYLEVAPIVLIYIKIRKIVGANDRIDFKELIVKQEVKCHPQFTGVRQL